MPVYRTNDIKTGFYFNTELRIGVSRNNLEVKNCLVNNGDSPVTHRNINGADFSVFAIKEDAPSLYLEGLSYRVVRDNACYAMEQLKNGNYQIANASASSTLGTNPNDYYYAIDEIISTFQFVDLKK